MRFGVCFTILLCLATVATQPAQPRAIHATPATLWRPLDCQGATHTISPPGGCRAR